LRVDLIETFFNGPVLWAALPLLLEGLGTTVLLGAVSIALGLLSGLLLALLRLYGPPALRALARGYIDVFRSLPLLVLLVLVYYALPFVGMRLSSFAAAATALSLVSCAYTAEIFRAGIQAIPRGQTDAAQALGLGFVDTLRSVLLPQALRIVTPPLTGNCINVLKDTALASVVAMPDLLKQATQAQALAASPTPLIGAAALYLLLLLPLIRLVSRFESRRDAALR
jgi:polar amino acid transport system permease protein